LWEFAFPFWQFAFPVWNSMWPIRVLSEPDGYLRTFIQHRTIPNSSSRNANGCRSNPTTDFAAPRTESREPTHMAPLIRASRLQYWFSFEDTPKALANSSPGFELARTLGPTHKRRSNPVRVCQPLNPFRVLWQCLRFPGLSLALQPWARISQRLRRNFKLNQYQAIRSVDTFTAPAYHWRVRPTKLA
jgi:hypothetical protein